MLTQAWRISWRCALLTLLALVFATAASANSSGSANVFVMAGSSYDPFLSNPSPQEQAWFSSHIWRMGVYAPYFNERTSWYHDGWVYKDAYALYNDTEHPEWVAKDASGNNLYIPWGCSGGTCPQYAANIAIPAYRQAWIESLKAEVAHGYRGVFIDDVNMSLDVGNGRGEAVAPVDPATGEPMTEEAWRGYMARFMQEVRAALPTVEIVHNGVWFDDEDAGTSNPNIRAEIESANYYFLERGANDPGLTGGNGPWSLNAVLSFIDQVHALGRAVVLDGTAEDPQGLAYNLASYFLISDGSDGVAGGGQTPESWWSGWSTNLGEATGARYTWQKLLRRNFTDGLVLVNPPDEPTETVALPYAMKNLEGETVTSVTLTAASGAILVGSPPSSGPTASEPPAPTQTTVETSLESSPLSPAATVSAPTSPVPATDAPSPGVPGNAPISSPAPVSRSDNPTLGPVRGRRRSRHARTSRNRGRHKRLLTRIAGRVLHATAGKTTIDVERLRGRRWVLVARVTARLDGTGRFADRLPLSAGERYRVRAFYGGTSSFQASSSRYRVLVLRAASRSAGAGRLA